MPNLRSLAIAVGLISGAALAYQVLLIRLLAIIEWHHLAFLVISLALLGYGVSGTMLALARSHLLRHFRVSTASSAAAFGVTSVASFAIAQRLGVNSLEIFWSVREAANLFLLYLLFAVPFFCAATAVGLALSNHGAESPRLYRADLIGGGVSAAAVTALLFIAHPITVLQFVAAAGFVAAALFARRRGVVALLAAGVVVAVATPQVTLPLRITQFKELSHAMRIPGARVVDERSSPLGTLTTLASPEVPFRHAPGLSLAFTGDIPAQLGVFTDGGGMTPIVIRGSGSVEYLRWLPTAVAYNAGIPKRRVAILGAGGAAEVRSALVHGAERVMAVEVNPQMVELVERRFASESGQLYADPRVRVVVADARRFVRETEERYDAIQLALVGSQSGAAAGVQALSESSLYTVEAMMELIRTLRPGGYLVVTRWIQAPPREAVKLVATVIEAQERLGAVPARRLAIVRGWNTATVVVKNGDFLAAEIASLRTFCDERSFDLDYAPGVRREETNQYNVLEESYLYDATRALLAGGRTREDFFQRYKFNVRPASDERPYFFHSFRWSALPELLQLRARGGMPLLEWGYVVLIAALVQATLAAVILILLPLTLVRRRAKAGEPAWRLVVYFGSIGLAFLFVEIAFMQRLTLFLGEPLYAITVVLSSFLLFGGLGSGMAARIGDDRARRVPLLVAGIALAALLVARVLPALALAFAAPAKIALSIVVVAPLAFVMGMPFPLGLRALAARDPESIPWAWGINGTASVLSSMLATLVAVHFGFTVVVLAAAMLYAIASLAFAGREARQSAR